MKCIRMLTFLPLDQINEMDKWEGGKLNEAKEILAYELTKLVHGEEEAQKAQSAAAALFGGGGNTENMPSTEVGDDEIKDGINILELMLKAQLIPSKSDGRRLVQQGGVSINGDKITDFNYSVTKDNFDDNGEIIIKKGKKIACSNSECDFEE